MDRILRNLRIGQNSYKHLTGVITDLSPNNFYDKIEDNKIKVTEAGYDKDGYAKLKLSIIGQILQIISTNTIFGSSNGSRLNITASHFIGTKSRMLTVALNKKQNKSYFYPLSLLKGDVNEDV